MQYRVASLALDPEAGTLFYTTDNLTLPQPAGLRPEDGQVEDAAQGTAYRRPGIQPRRPVALGAAHQQRLRDPGAHSLPVHRMADGARVPVWRSRVRPRRLPRRLAGIDLDGRARLEPRRGAGHAGPRHEDRVAARGRRDADAHARRSAARCRRGSCSRRTAGTCTAAPTTRAFRTSTATRSPRPRLEAVSNAETGFFRPVPLSDDELLVFNYTAAGFVPAMIRPATDRGPERDHLPRRADRDQASGRAGLERGVAGALRLRVRDRAAGDLPTGARARPRSVVSDRRGLQGLRGARRARAVQRSDRLQHRERHGELQSRRLAALEGARACGGPLPAGVLGGRAQLERRRLLRPVRADQAQPRGLQRLRGLRPADRSTSRRRR